MVDGSVAVMTDTTEVRRFPSSRSPTGPPRWPAPFPAVPHERPADDVCRVLRYLARDRCPPYTIIRFRPVRYLPVARPDRPPPVDQEAEKNTG